MLNEVEDSVDDVWKYDFKNINKWMPLVFYDEIKARNTIQVDQKKTTSLPFFLDFNNID